jgi:sugar phosphate isomerase/epimerase
MRQTGAVRDAGAVGVTALGVQLYSLRQELSADTLRRLAEIGYVAVEGFDPLTDPAGFRAALDDAGLAMWSTHGPVLREGRDRLPEALATLGTDTVIIPSVPASEFAGAAGVVSTAQRINEAAEWAAEHGLRLGYHNHHWELASRIDGRPALEVLADRLLPEVFLEVDVYWAAVGGVDVPDLLARLDGRVRYLHVKDGPATVDAPMTAVGSGTLPIRDILAAAPHARRVVELDRCATDMLAALADSYAFLAI